MALPRRSSVKQLMNMKKRIGRDIGDITKTIGEKSANLDHISGLSDINITSYEDFIDNKEGFGIITKKKKNVMKKNKSIKESREPMLNCILCGGKLKIDINDDTVCEDCGEIHENVLESKDNFTGPDIPSKIKPIEVPEPDVFNGGYMGPTKNSLYGDTNYKQKNNIGNTTLDLLRLYKHVIIKGEDYFIDKLVGNTIYLKSRVGMKDLKLNVKEFINKYKCVDGTFRVNETIFIKEFKNFNNINDNYSPLKYDEDTYGIFKKLEEEFDVKKLEVNKTKDGKYSTYTYIMKDGTIIECEDMGDDKDAILYINDKKIDYRRGVITYKKFFGEQEQKLNENILPKPVKRIKCIECGESICDTWKDKVAHVQNKHFIKPSINDDLIKNTIKTCFPK